ncbi:hypothetical protein ACFLYO_03535 [Chloroflexota bacterium]
MSIAVYWNDDTQTLLYYQVPPTWTWADLDQAMRQGHTMIATVDHPVHSVLDFRQCQHLPTGQTLNGQAGRWTWQPNAGQSFFVASSRYLHSLFAVLSTAYPQLNQQTVLVNTLGEARLYLSDLGCVLP